MLYRGLKIRVVTATLGLLTFMGFRPPALSQLAQVAAPSVATPISATLKVDWKKTVGTAAPLLYGSNDTLMTDPDLGARDAKYAANLKTMGIPFLRLHNGGLTEDWIDTAKQTWDRDKIAAGYAAPYLQNAVVMQTIPAPPPWCMTTDKKVDPEKYAKFCAQLVDFVNVKLHKHVLYWEPMNEWDMGMYSKQSDWITFCHLFNQCVLAMKQVDPTIKVGGPALAWGNLEKVDTFLQLCGPNVSFLSWHTYGTGDPKESTDGVMSRTKDVGDRVRAVRSLVVKHGYKNKIILAVNEFNVNFNWDPIDARQHNNEGAVFLASVLKYLAEASLDIGASWNAKDDGYGLMDLKDNLRPAAQVYAWGNHSLIGTVVATHSDQPMVEALAVRGSRGKRAILLINKSAGIATIKLDAGIGKLNTPSLPCSRIDSQVAGVWSHIPSACLSGNPIIMPAHSLMLIRLPNP